MNITYIETISDILLALKEYPNKANELKVLFGDTLDKAFDNKINCEKVFINKSEEGNSPVVVIPIMPTSDILEVNNIKHYDIEINLSSFEQDQYSVNEMVAWLLHELCENVITDNTLLRFKTMLIKYYNNMETGIKSVIRTIGYSAWIGIFSRTKKCFIDDMNNDFFNNYLTNYNLDNYINFWNSSLSKYISKNGGNNNILMDNYINNKDKAEFLTFNKLARKYSAYAIKYNDTTYSTFAKYLIANTNSELLKYYILKEPKQLAIFKEKEIFNIFNDNKILYELAGSELLEGIKTRNFIREYSELELDVDNVISTYSDKIKTAVKLNDFSLDISKELKSDTLNSNVLQDLREKSFNLINKLNDKETVQSVMEEFI